MSGTVPPLRGNRDFLLLWSGQVVSVLGTRISAVACPLLVLALRGSAWDAGLVGFAATAPYALVRLPAGVLVVAAGLAGTHELWRGKEPSIRVGATVEP